MANGDLHVISTKDSSANLLIGLMKQATSPATAAGVLGWSGEFGQTLNLSATSQAELGWSGDFEHPDFLIANVTGELAWSGEFRGRVVMEAIIGGDISGQFVGGRLGWTGEFDEITLVEGAGDGELGWTGEFGQFSLLDSVSSGTLGWLGDFTGIAQMQALVAGELGWSGEFNPGMGGRIGGELGWSGEFDAPILFASLDACGRLPWADLILEGATHSFTFLPSQNPFLSALQRPQVVSLGRLRRPSSITGAEAANASLQLDNADGSLTELLAGARHARLLLRRVVEGDQGAAEVVVDFDGVINGTGRGRTLDVRAVGAALNSRVPLRPATIVGQYAGTGYLPLPFGRGVQMHPIQFSADQRQWLVADGVIAGVTAVADTEGKPIAPSEYLLVPEVVDGLPVSVLVLAAAPSTSAPPIVTLDGLLDPDTGVLLENPALIAWYLLSQVAGYSISKVDVDAYRVRSLDIALRGMVDNSQPTLRAQLDEIFQSAQAIWSLGMPGLARPWPPILADGVPLAGVLTECVDPEPTQQDMAINNRVELEFDYSWATQDYGQAIIAQADLSIERFGVQQPDQPFTMRWLGDPVIAERFITSRLGFEAQENYRVRFDAAGLNFNPGDEWDCQHSLAPLRGRQFVIEAGLDLTANSTEIEVAGALDWPANPVKSRVVQRSTRLISESTTLEVRELPDSLVFVAKDRDTGLLLPGATVVIAGRTSVANGRGEATFVGIEPGEYTIFISAPGKESFTETYTVAG